MNIVRPNYQISTQPESPLGVLQHIEKAARVCYKSEDRITEDGESAIKIVNNLRERKHEAMIEHSSYIVRMDDPTYSYARELINHCEESGYRIYLRRTVEAPEPFEESRNIVSGNVRAWRDFFHACKKLLALFRVFYIFLILRTSIKRCFLKNSLINLLMPYWMNEAFVLFPKKI
jgi:thymidylate synthase ThyX